MSSNSYSIQFISKPQKGTERTWKLSECCNMDQIQTRLRRIRQLVTIFTGSGSDILSDLTDWGNIVQSCNPIWERTIIIPEPRIYTLSINLTHSRAIVATRNQSGVLHKVGLVDAVNMNSYQDVIRLMEILIRVLEGNNSPNIQCVNDMAFYRGEEDTLSQQNHLLDLLRAIFASPTDISNPPEINIYVPISSYKIIIERQ